MNVALARTFIAVVETGSFAAAGGQENVTQSTVSMRIKALEDRLGKTLFDRGKTGAVLTPAGVQFQKHALTMIRVWEQARLEVALPEGYQAAITIGGQYGLWDGFLLEWLARMRSNAAHIAVRAQFGGSEALMNQLVAGSLDVGVMYRPQNRPGFEVELLFEEELVLVSSEPLPQKAPGSHYIFVDWGPEFQADHSLNFPDMATPAVVMELGSVGLNYLLQNRAAGYFPKRLVVPHLISGKLKLVPDTPVFHYPAYVVYPADMDTSLKTPILKNLRKIGAVRQAA